MTRKRPIAPLFAAAISCAAVLALFALSPALNPEPQVDTTGVVMYVGGRALGLTNISADYDLTDLTRPNAPALTGTNTSRYFPLDAYTRYYNLINGTPVPATKKALSIGDRVLVTHGEDGIRRITIMNKA